MKSMQVDPSICEDTDISEKEKGWGEEISEPFTAKLEPYLLNFIQFKLPPKKEKVITFFMAIYTAGFSSAL